VRTSLFNKTKFDPYVNLLRTTVEAFAAVLGGCDSLQVGAFDEIVRPANEFSQRVARNQQLVLREECHLTQVIDPAGGSWFVETLTDQLARRAWEVFQDIERRGGMTAAMREGWPQREVSKVAEERLQNVARRRDQIIGTNIFASPGEALLEVPPSDPAGFHRRRAQQIADLRTAADEADHQAVLDRLSKVIDPAAPGLFDAAVEAVVAGATLGEVTRALRIREEHEAPIVPVCLTRAASGFETLRAALLAREADQNRRLTVFLANLGPLKQHKARADFARGFFEAGGFSVINPLGFKTAEEAAAIGADAGADAVCLCSTDETYPALVPPLVQTLRARNSTALVILAGYPPDQVEAHRNAGVEEFIHVRANALEVLTRIAKRLGVSW
jgi:methylmalonyl-CoA mutase